MPDSIRRAYIMKVYEMLERDGFENVSIRKIAAALDCNSATLYKYFGSVNDLVAIASVRFLRPYYQGLAAISAEHPSSIDLCLQSWEIFAYYAFRKVPIFENLYFNESRTPRRAIEQYFDDFPEDRDMLKDYLSPITETDDLMAHDRLFLSMAARQGMIEQESVDYLANLCVYVFEGMLHAYRETYREEGMPAKITAKFMNILYRAYENALLPGKQLATQSPAMRASGLHDDMFVEKILEQGMDRTASS